MDLKRSKMKIVWGLVTCLAIVALALAAFSLSATAQSYPPPPQVDDFEAAEAAQMLLPDKAAVE